MSYPKTLRLVIKAPGQPPEIKEFPVTKSNVLSLVQKLVGGCVEQVYVSQKVAILCDEDGAGPENCGLLGTFVFVGLGKYDWVGLTPEQADKAVKWCCNHALDRHPGGAWEILTGDAAAQRMVEISEIRQNQDREWDAL